MISVVERLGSTIDDRVDDIPPGRELARELPRVMVRELSALLGVFPRMLASFRMLREKKAPIGRMLAARMPMFCSKLVHRVSTGSRDQKDSNSHCKERRAEGVKGVYTEAADLRCLVCSSYGQDSDSTRDVSMISLGHIA
jgi:hypothetical protein